MDTANLVLVVDDDASMLTSLARMLRQFGYTSLLFPSAEAFENHSDFDGAVCVLLDIDLGDVSGIELRYRLKARGNSIPVIYMTGNDRHDCASIRVSRYLAKPFLHEVADGADRESFGCLTKRNRHATPTRFRILMLIDVQTSLE